MRSTSFRLSIVSPALGVAACSSSNNGTTANMRGAGGRRSLFDTDLWEKDTYATKFSAYASSHGSSTAQTACNATLGFGLRISSGKAYVDKLWSMGVPSHAYWNGILCMLALLQVSGTFHLYC